MGKLCICIQREARVFVFVPGDNFIDLFPQEIEIDASFCAPGLDIRKFGS